MVEGAERDGFGMGIVKDGAIGLGDEVLGETFHAGAADG